jgi:hypothetical protein
MSLGGAAPGFSVCSNSNCRHRSSSSTRQDAADVVVVDVGHADEVELLARSPQRAEDVAGVLFEGRDAAAIDQQMPRRRVARRDQQTVAVGGVKGADLHVPPPRSI